MNNQRELKCEEALRLVAAYIDGELDAAADRDVESHLARCRGCYSRAEFERQLKSRLAAIGRAAVPPEFTTRIQQLLETFPKAPRTREP